jgi:hypothetical protein
MAGCDPGSGFRSRDDRGHAIARPGDGADQHPAAGGIGTA